MAVQQNLMNKLNAKTMSILLPLQHPSPDYKNKNRVTKTSSPSQQVKKYLLSIKKNTHAQAGQNKSNILSNLLDNQDETVIRSNEDILRKRINQLQIENNEFRIFVRQYDILVGRNRELEEQMLLLLQQLEARGDVSQESQKFATQQTDTRRKAEDSAKNQFYLTTQSSRSKTAPKSLQNYNQYGNIDSIQIKAIQAFNSITIDQISYPKLQNQQTKELVNQEIKRSIQSLEAKFSNFIASMQQKINQLNFSNHELMKKQHIKFSESDSKQSSGQNVNTIKAKDQKMNQNKEWNKWDKSSHNSEFEQKNSLYEKSWNKGLYLQPVRGSEKQQEFKRQQSNGSIVNIEGSCLSQSNQSFGKSYHKNDSPKTQNNFFKNIQCVESQSPRNQNYQRSIIDRIWENIRNLRSNLTYLLGESSIKKQQNILDIEESIERQISSILNIFFPKLNGKLPSNSALQHMRNDDLLSECLQMRQKIQQQNDEILNLQHDLKLLKAQQPLSSSRQTPIKGMRVASQIYLQNSYYLDLKSQCTIQLSETKRKLEEIISIMRSFNEQYHHILEGHSQKFLLIDSHQRIP